MLRGAEAKIVPSSLVRELVVSLGVPFSLSLSQDRYVILWRGIDGYGERERVVELSSPLMSSSGPVNIIRISFERLRRLRLRWENSCEV